MNKALLILLAFGIFVALPANAADPNAEKGDVTVFDPDRDIPARLLPHDSSTVNNQSDWVPTTEPRADVPVRPVLVNPDSTSKPVKAPTPEQEPMP